MLLRLVKILSFVRIFILNKYNLILLLANKYINTYWCRLNVFFLYKPFLMYTILFFFFFAFKLYFSLPILAEEGQINPPKDVYLPFLVYPLVKLCQFMNYTMSLITDILTYEFPNNSTSTTSTLINSSSF